MLPEVLAAYTCGCCPVWQFMITDLGVVLVCVRDERDWWCECTSGVMPDEAAALCSHAYAARLLLPELADAAS